MDKEVNIVVDSLSLPGTLTLPEKAGGIVLFAHGSGSSRFSSRNRFVAGVLQKAAIGTLLFDLLTQEEDQVYENRFNIDLITERLVKATDWLAGQDEARGLAFGYFGASTGAAAALKAAARLGSRTKAVVSRGGRPDLAMEVLSQVEAPTLLIVGALDEVVLGFNRQAYEKLKATKNLEIIPGATHLFEEPGTLELAAQAAAAWFKKHLSS
ncbi:MAG: dienelactone hydrolase family protein [Deltaproteobacteria bacterium]|nr:dienelactone hydrolase family protein [Deltaproteobacteria bacterium]